MRPTKCSADIALASRKLKKQTFGGIQFRLAGVTIPMLSSDYGLFIKIAFAETDYAAKELEK